MARPNKQKIDHENLRDWLVCRPTEAGQVLSKVLQCVNEAFPDTPAQFAAGSPSGALLTVHWGADGEITEAALLIEGV